MKKIPNQQAGPATTLCLIFICLLLPFFSNGQTWVTPTHARTLLGAIGADPRINCANITYIPGAPGTTGQLSAICWDKASSPFASGPGFVVMDGQGNTHVEMHPATFTNATKLDIIVGNAVITNGGQGYRIGVVYISSGNVLLDVYDVLNIGTPSLTTNYVTTITIASAGTQPNDPRIDIIAEYADTHILGLPYCSKYVITYSNILGGNTNIEGYQGDLNFGPTATNTIASIPFTGIPLRAPDVAGIQINSTGGPQDYARFAFMDASYNIEEAEWNISTNTIAVLPTVVMTAPHAMWPNAYGYYFPRIDAIDNYLTSMNANQANYQIVANLAYLQFVTSGTPPVTLTTYNYYIKGYNNYAGLISFSSPYADAYENVSPCVAAGPINEYTACYYTAHPNPSGAGGHDIAQTVDFGSGLLSNSNLYQIDSTGQTTADTGELANSPVCISAGFNDTKYVLVAWCNNLTDLYFKFTGNPIAFKQANDIAAETAGHISIWPNPVSDYLSVSGTADKYVITDVEGRSLQNAILPGDKRINIQGLSAGTYILTLYQQGKNVRTEKFVKQ